MNLREYTTSVDIIAHCIEAREDIDSLTGLHPDQRSIYIAPAKDNRTGRGYIASAGVYYDPVTDSIWSTED